MYVYLTLLMLDCLVYLKADNLAEGVLNLDIMKLDREYARYLLINLVLYYVTKFLLNLCSERLLPLSNILGRLLLDDGGTLLFYAASLTGKHGRGRQLLLLIFFLLLLGLKEVAEVSCNLANVEFLVVLDSRVHLLTNLSL